MKVYDACGYRECTEGSKFQDPSPANCCCDENRLSTKDADCITPIVVYLSSEELSVTYFFYLPLFTIPFHSPSPWPFSFSFAYLGWCCCVVAFVAWWSMTSSACLLILVMWLLSRRVQCTRTPLHLKSHNRSMIITAVYTLNAISKLFRLICVTKTSKINYRFGFVLYFRSFFFVFQLSEFANWSDSLDCVLCFLYIIHFEIVADIYRESKLYYKSYQIWPILFHNNYTIVLSGNCRTTISNVPQFEFVALFEL